MPRLPPQEGLPPPLCIPPLASSEDALYVVNRTLHLLIKPDNLTCYQQAQITDPLQPESKGGSQERHRRVFACDLRLQYSKRLQS